jgi:hypothetical protein
MRKSLLVAALLLISLPGRGDEQRVVRPFESEGGFKARNAIDEAVLAALRRRGIEPAHPCSDAVFVRRVHVDVIGTLPAPKDVVAFLQDRRPDKRAKLIDALLERDEFADYWSLKWCDLLRVKSEFPINLWPNAVQAYHRWIHDAIRLNRPYDHLVREMLTASGSNFREPAVNFWRAIQSREPHALAQAVMLTLLGVRSDGWPEARRNGPPSGRRRSSTRARRSAAPSGRSSRTAPRWRSPPTGIRAASSPIGWSGPPTLGSRKTS